MRETRISQLQKQVRRVFLFDPYGLPWTAHLSMGWMLFVFAMTGGLAAIPIGLYLGLWISAKTQSTITLLIYTLLALGCAVLFLPNLTPPWTRADGVAAVVLWFAGALAGRRQIVQYYTQREGSQFRLSLAFTLLFGIWYLNYRIRPEFPYEHR